MKIKAKLRRIGNSQGVYIPKEVITGYVLGDEIELDVITKQGEMVNNGQKVITSVLKENDNDWCDIHGCRTWACKDKHDKR